MSSPNNTGERDSYWKSHMLKKGEYDVWASEMQTHIMAVDGECCKLIMKGPHKLEPAYKKHLFIEEYIEADYKKAEKNSKALKLITNGLSATDKRTVLSSLTAKDKWDVLEKLCQGSNKVKRDKIATLLYDYNTIVMREKEDIEDFQDRFLTIINSLEYLSEHIEN